MGRWYQRDEQGLIVIRDGEWEIEGDWAHRIDPEWGVARDGVRFVGRRTLEGWPDSEVAEYEGGVMIPVATARQCPHGEPLGDCTPCDVAADFAFDAAREDSTR